MNASIITIGDELLIGQVIDTNSAFIAQQLNKIGVAVKHRLAVGDDKNDIWQALDAESNTASIIILTGGLGPTADDITKPLLCEYFNGTMILDNETLQHVEYLFTQVLKRPMIERNRMQAMVPDVCTVLKNDVGTAPGMMFEKNGVLYFALPGVPHEMKWLMENKVLPIIKTKNTGNFIQHRTLMTAGVGESFLAERLGDFETQLPANIKLAYLPNYGLVRLRLTANGSNETQLNEIVNQQFTQLKNIVTDVMITDKDETVETIVANLLKQNNQTVATAESCTGGYIAHLLTSLNGSSSYYEGSVVSYSYAAKENLLKVSTDMLLQFGAVSEQVVTTMAKNLLQLMHTNYAIGVSGIMGPAGGTPDKPVGSVWVCVASQQRIITRLFKFRFDRKKNIELTAINSLLLLRELIVEKPCN